MERCELSEQETAGYDARLVRLKIKEGVTRKHISQRKLAKLADIVLRHVQRILRDPYTAVTMRTLGSGSHKNAGPF